MLEFIIPICTAAACLAIGLAMFKAIDWAIAGRRVVLAPAKRMTIVVFGAILLVGGIAWMVGVMVFLVAAVRAGKIPRGDDSVAAAIVASDLVLSLVPIGGALLLAVGILLGREHTPANLVKLYTRLDGVSVIAWCWVVLGIVLTCLATFGGFPLFVLVLAVVAVRLRHGAQQDGLIWVLAISTQKKLPLAGAVEEYAAECRGRYRRRVLQLADRLEIGQSLPEAIEADTPSLVYRLLRRISIARSFISPTIQLLPPPARVAARVGWETGTLGQAMRDVAIARTLHRPDWLEALWRLWLLILPLLFLQSIGGFVLYFIAPKFRRIFYDFGVELPEVTQVVYEFSDIMIEGAGLPIFLLSEVFLALCLLMTFRSAWSATSHFPLDRLFRMLDRAVILRALAVCVEGGQTLTVGLRALAECYPKVWVRTRLARVIDKMDQGTSWEQCLRSQRLIRPTEAALLESAQRAGNLAWAMRELADRGERRLAYGLQIFVQVLFPIVLLGVAGVVFLFAVGYFSPLVKLISELSG